MMIFCFGIITYRYHYRMTGLRSLEHCDWSRKSWKLLFWPMCWDLRKCCTCKVSFV